jgi:LacI family transcriptional regulator
MAAKRVVLLIETSNAYARGLLRGIRSYVRARGDWSIYLGEQRRGESAPQWLANWQGDGIIARIETREIADAVLDTKLPAVDVSAAQYIPQLPFVETDDREIAAAAAEHLLGRGLRSFGYSGDQRFMWSNQRRDHFVSLIHEAGFSCGVHESDSRKRSTWESQFTTLTRWLQNLPKPCGVMACYDIRGREILDACHAAQIAVPDEVAVIGADDDDLICELAEPRLSSVIPNTHRTGYEAAALLDRMMAGEQVPAGAYLIPPIGVATRHSTDMLAVDDPHVATALRFIRDHACEGINVEDVVAAVPLSRRVLEARFKQLTGKTPHEEIQRVQIDRVQQLLTQTDMSLEAIAHRCGFRHAEYMGVAFKRVVGIPPGRFRELGRST